MEIFDVQVTREILKSTLTFWTLDSCGGGGGSSTIYWTITFIIRDFSSFPPSQEEIMEKKRDSTRNSKECECMLTAVPTSNMKPWIFVITGTLNQ